MDIKGLQSVTFAMNEREFTYVSIVGCLPVDVKGLFGTDFDQKAGAVIAMSAVRYPLRASAMCHGCLGSTCKAYSTHSLL